MLPPELPVLLGRLPFPDAQKGMTGALQHVGVFETSWYGTDVSDDRGCFALVDPNGPLFGKVGDFLGVEYRGRTVMVFVIGSYARLPTPLALTRRAYLAISVPAVEPILAAVGTLL